MVTENSEKETRVQVRHSRNQMTYVHVTVRVRNVDVGRDPDSRRVCVCGPECMTHILHGKVRIVGLGRVTLMESDTI